MTELTIRLIVSLAIVLGLLLLCARVAGRRFQGRRDAVVQVVHRQPIGRHASVSVVNVSGRILVLGTTDQEVRLLTELDPAAIAEDDTDDADDADHADDRLLTLVSRGVADSTPVSWHPAPFEAPIDTPSPAVVLHERDTRPGRHVAPRRGTRTQATHPAPSGGLSGSVLSVRTWRQAWGAVTGHAS